MINSLYESSNPGRQAANCNASDCLNYLICSFQSNEKISCTVQSVKRRLSNVKMPRETLDA